MTGIREDLGGGKMAVDRKWLDNTVPATVNPSPHCFASHIPINILVIFCLTGRTTR